MGDPNSDAYLNEVMVAGGLWMALASQFGAEPVMADGQATNELYVHPEYMKSRYRLTVTLDPVPEADRA